ncbi:MAG: phosphodiesterase [Alphaproteobacteria bacterium]
MLRIAHLTDPHVTAPQHLLCGLHTPSLLRRALAAVEARPAGFYDAVVITGDLTHQGEPAAYEELARCLEGVAPPVYLIIGNHDDREAFRAVFGGEPRYVAGDFVQYAVDDFASHRLVFLDTSVSGSARGLLCQARLGWLDEVLGERPETPTLVFLHHPPFTTHIPPLDAIGLDGIEGLARVIARHSQVLSLHAGHVHRPIYGRLGRTPVTAVTSTCHQTVLDLETPELVVTYEPPSFGLILAEAEDVLCHTVYFGEAEGPRLPYAPMRGRYDPA